VRTGLVRNNRHWFFSYDVSVLLRFMILLPSMNLANRGLFIDENTRLLRKIFL
jgi:hypothetical protein